MWECFSVTKENLAPLPRICQTIFGKFIILSSIIMLNVNRTNSVRCFVCKIQVKLAIPYSFNSLQWRRRVNQWFTHASRNSTLIAWINTPTHRCHARDNQVRWLRFRVTSLQWVKWKGYNGLQTLTKGMGKIVPVIRSIYNWMDSPGTFHIFISEGERFRSDKACLKAYTTWT